MMIQSLVENAIKHGLEPKAEGGQLDHQGSRSCSGNRHGHRRRHRQLGFGRAEQAGAVGLVNIRERLRRCSTAIAPP